jgi:hypothetical protein
MYTGRISIGVVWQGDVQGAWDWEFSGGGVTFPTSSSSYTPRTDPRSRSFFIFSWVKCFGYLLLGCSLISISYIICMLTLLLMPLAGLRFCLGLDFVTPSL